MANNNEKNQEKSLGAPNAGVELTEEEKINRPSSHFKIQSYFFNPGLSIFIAVAAVIIAGYSIQYNDTLQKNIAEQNTAFTNEIRQLKTSDISYQEKLNKTAQQFQQVQDDLQKKVDDLNKQLQTALNQKLYQNQDWLLLKARYYLELAQINAHWSDNFSAALALLQEADKLLTRIHGRKILDVRQAIAKEIAQIKSIPAVDIAGLLSQLDAAQSSVNTLTIQSNLDENSEKETETSQSEKHSAWQKNLHKSLNLLSKLVVIRREDGRMKPLISPLFESALKESIRLNLQEAQWAILNNNPVVYQLVLKQACANLRRAFDLTSQNTTNLLKQLTELQQIKISSEKPTSELALPLLNQIIDSKELSGDAEHPNDEKGDKVQ